MKHKKGAESVGKDEPMKKYFAAFLLLTLCLTGCKAKETAAPSTPSDVPIQTPTIEADAFYTAYKNAEKRPVAVMVDNDNKDAWPHAGLSDAYLIYEVPVEGGATRLMALFNEQTTDKIGPVRSSRHYFLDYVLEHDAIYTHFGYSPRAMADIPALGVNNINGVLGSDSGAFWRETKYVGDYHSAFTSMEKINKMVEKKDYRTEREKAPLLFAETEKTLEGTPAADITIPYSGGYRSGFLYNAETGTYAKYMNGSIHALQGGKSLAVKNIIIMTVKSYPLGDGSARINIDTVGSGKGQYITMGQAVPITWEKSSRSGKTTWKDASGAEIALNPGQTFVMLVPNTVSVSVK